MYFEHDDLKKIIPLLSAIAITIGYLAKHLYFKHFGISILGYLDTSEVIVAAGKDLLRYGFTIVLSVVFFTIVSSVNEVNIEAKKIAEIREAKSFKQRFKIYYKKYNTAFWGIYLGILSSAVIFIFKLEISDKNYLINYFSLFVLIILHGIVVGELDYKANALYKKPIPITYKNASLIVIVLSYFICVINVDRELHDVSSSGKYQGSYIITKEHKYISDSNQTIIGETKNYIFFHNKIDSTTLVFDRKNIDEYKIKVNKLNSLF